MARRNLSVEQFKQLMENIPKVVAKELQRVPFEQGLVLANAMKSAVPEGTDAVRELRDSIRVEPGRRPLQVFVRAGGPTTTKRGKLSGRPYDYALANEFGTQKMAAQPFFWPTYRLLKKRIRAAMARRARLAISKVVPLK
jgi:HK97 gp10 family phage protein